MKKSIAFFYFILSILILSPFVTAQTGAGFRGQSLNGSTGLFSIPTGRIGWEKNGSLGLDLGYRVINNNDRGMTHIPAITASLMGWVELSGAFDFQPNIYNHYDYNENYDAIIGFKIKLPTNSENSTAVAIGTNLQHINFLYEDRAEQHNLGYNAYQPYLAITYTGKFFAMTSETTVVFGKTFYSGRSNNSDIDFGMGFDLILFPDVFGNAVHWIIDFANFSYSDNAWPNNVVYGSGPAQYRGILNCGFRIDLSSFSAFNKHKFLLDFIFVDLFDHVGRSFSFGAVFGFSSS